MRRRVVRATEAMLKRERMYRYIGENLHWDAKDFSGGQWITEDYKVSDLIKRYL
jgi:hypothetical protein